MDILLWVLMIAIIVMTVAFVIIKVKLNKKLDSIDGFGGTTKNADDQKIISAFGGVKYNKR